MWKIVLPSREDDDLQGFPHEEISKSEILDMVCAMRSVEATDTDKTEEWQNSNVCEVGFQQNNVHATAKRKHEEEGGEVIIFYGGDKNEIHTAVRRSINSSQKNRGHYKLYFSK
jgi:hypothetical protein